MRKTHDPYLDIPLKALRIDFLNASCWPLQSWRGLERLRWSGWSDSMRECRDPSGSSMVADFSRSRRLESRVVLACTGGTTRLGSMGGDTRHRHANRHTHTRRRDAWTIGLRRAVRYESVRDAASGRQTVQGSRRYRRVGASVCGDEEVSVRLERAAVLVVRTHLFLRGAPSIRCACVVGE